ncbi:hypothetical protein DFO66_103370 [Brevibacterium sanguinis]|uniref:Uncharacterized protein n=3 Tax=Brevibacteriaceae TaxID=85019 RepID=A0A366IKY3_9MICO|nr:hypothetical protein DFO66_103370 [Brevibacterium sanguinis]RBP73072.1 hypothetical protein DFO65_103370 [Brevibacterium celere]
MRSKQMHLEINTDSIEVDDCPTCGEHRLARFEVVAMNIDGVGTLTQLTRCYSCNPIEGS